MKLYIVYFRTMQDSPEVEIRCVTTSEIKANEALKKAGEDVAEWMEDEDEGSGNWADACKKSFDISEYRKPGDIMYVVVETVWHEYVETTVCHFLYEVNAKTQVEYRREELLSDYPGLEQFDEDELIHESMHLEDPCVMVDVYFCIEEVVVE